MRGQFLLVSFNWKTKIKITSLEPIFNEHALDWARYAANNWIVWTDESANAWFHRLVPQLEGNDTLFICRLDIGEMAGHMPSWIWPWLTEPRD